MLDPTSYMHSKLYFETLLGKISQEQENAPLQQKDPTQERDSSTLIEQTSPVHLYEKKGLSEVWLCTDTVFTLNKENRPYQHQWVGTNGQLLVKHINEDEPPIPEKFGMYRRIEHFFSAIEWFLKQSDSFNLAVLEDIDRIRSEFNYDLYSKKINLYGYGIPASKRKKVENDLGKKIITQVIDVLLKNDSSVSSKTFQQWKDILKDAEKEFLCQKQRPNIIHIISDADNKKQFFSTSFPQGKNSIPSSKKREASVKNDGIPNHDIAVTAARIQDHTNIKIAIHSILHSHISYSYYDEPDSYERQLANDRSVQHVIDAIYKITRGSNENPQQNSPIALTSMILLTPKIGEQQEHFIVQCFNFFTSIFRKGKEAFVNETSQLRDSLLALEKHHYRNRDTDQFNSTYMNVPVNFNPTILKIFTSPLQKGINARGMVQYNQHMISFLQNKKNILPYDNDEINTQIDTVLQGLSSPQKNKKMRVLNQKIKQYEDRLKNQVRQLDALAEQIKYAADHLPAIQLADPTIIQSSLLKKLKKQYQKQEFVFYETIQQRNKVYQKIHSIQEKNYKDRAQPIRQVCEAIQFKLQSQQATLNQESFHYLLTAQRYFLSLDLFYHQKYLLPDYLYQFQVLYLLNQQSIGRHVESFCKSAKDRTGWLKFHIEEACKFVVEHGYHARFDHPEDRKKMQMIAHQIYPHSVALEVPKYNTGISKVQINPQLTGYLSPISPKLKKDSQDARLGKEFLNGFNSPYSGPHAFWKKRLQIIQKRFCTRSTATKIFLPDPPGGLIQNY